MIRKVSLVLLVMFFVAAGANHFRDPELYLPMMPDWLPWHRGLIALSGVAEILGGLGAGFLKWRRRAGWWLIALLVAVFPANVQMLVDHIPIAGKQLPEWVLWARLPLQLVMMIWVWWTCVKRRDVN